MTQQQVDEARTNERNAAVALTVATQQATRRVKPWAVPPILSRSLPAPKPPRLLPHAIWARRCCVPPLYWNRRRPPDRRGDLCRRGASAVHTDQGSRVVCRCRLPRNRTFQHRGGRSRNRMANGRCGPADPGSGRGSNSGVQPQTGDGSGGPGLPVVGRTLNWVVVAQRFPVWIRLLDAPPQDMRIGATASVRVEHDARQ